MPATAPNSSYTTRLQKGGALLPEMRRLVLEWDGSGEAAASSVANNLLSLQSRSRARDVVERCFVPRLVQSRPADLWRPLAVLEHAGWSAERLNPLYYYATAQAEPVLWDFVVEVLAERYGRGDQRVTTSDVLSWLARKPAERYAFGPWSASSALKVARGILAALRDFGVLEGKVKKDLVPLRLPEPSFALLARFRHDLGVQGRALLDDPVWRLFYLELPAVERLLLESHQRGYLGYHAAGSLVRIEFSGQTAEEYAHHLVERADRVA